jgi:class 3 adenylate cyclase
MSGSTALGERLDPEAVRRVMERYFAEMRSVVENHGVLIRWARDEPPG